MVEDIQDLVKNKRIIFVGNSVEIMHHKFGDLISSYDIVVRFGRALLATPEQEQSISNRCDIWVTGQFRAPCYNSVKEEFEYGRFKDTKILLNRCRGNFKLRNWVLENRLPKDFPAYTEMYSDEELVDLMKMFDKNLYNPKHDRPSAGFVTLLWFINKVKTYKSIDIIGFDFFAKTVSVPGLRDKRGRLSATDPHSWHLPCYVMDKSAHDKDLEQQYVSFLERRGDLKWNVISDLKTKSLKYNNWMKGEKLIKTAPKKSKVSKILPRVQQ